MKDFDDIWEYDEVSKHLFCKCCGNNMLMKWHKDECKHEPKYDNKTM